MSKPRASRPDRSVQLHFKEESDGTIISFSAYSGTRRENLSLQEKQQEFKQCSGPCGQTLPVSNFHKAGLGYQGKCKVCRSEYEKQWKRQNPQKLGEQRRRANKASRKYRRAHPERQRARDRKYRLKTEYDLTPEQYERILQLQGGACALCPRKANGKRRLAVDHNHTTDIVRGLLCDACNMALNRLETIVGWAAKAQVYLEMEHVWKKN